MTPIGPLFFLFPEPYSTASPTTKIVQGLGVCGCIFFEQSGTLGAMHAHSLAAQRAAVLVQGGVQRSRVSFSPCAPFPLRCTAHGISVLNGEVLASSVY